MLCNCILTHFGKSLLTWEFISYWNNWMFVKWEMSWEAISIKKSRSVFVLLVYAAHRNSLAEHLKGYIDQWLEKKNAGMVKNYSFVQSLHDTSKITDRCFCTNILQNCEHEDGFMECLIFNDDWTVSCSNKSVCPETVICDFVLCHEDFAIISDCKESFSTILTFFSNQVSNL